MPDLNNYVTSGALLGFKVGTQSRVNELIAAGTNAGATHGTFYLAQDTHRLYIGNEDTSISAVNEGIVTVSSISQLPTFTNDDQKRGAVGQFYYITGTGSAADQNILCVYNGRGWVQINTNTNDTINSYTIAVQAEDNNAGNVIQATVADTANHSYSGRFKVTGDNGVVVSYDTTSVTINGTEYTVPLITVSADYSLSVVTESNVTKVKLNSEDQSNDSSVGFTSGNYTGDTASNVIISKDGDNVKIAAKDTRTTGVSVAANSTAGFDVAITENYAPNNTVANTNIKTNFQPKIQYGSSPVTVDFVGGTATLNAYTKGEVDDLMKALNAMTYVGTYFNFGSAAGTPTAADRITVNANGTTVSLSGTNVPMHLGDTILVGENFTLGTTAVSKGSLLIARGTEDANGVITPATLTFDIVESTVDKDTTYRFTEITDGIALTDSVGIGRTQGGIKFAGTSTGTSTNDLIKVTKTYESAGSNAPSDAKIATITIEHRDVTRTDTTGTAVTSNLANITNGVSGVGSSAVTVVTGVTTNESGHITGVQTTSVTIRDSVSWIKSAKTTIDNAGIYTNASGRNVGVLKQTIVEQDAGNHERTTTDYSAISSTSLKIASDTQSITSSNSTTAAALNIEMVWGSF